MVSFLVSNPFPEDELFTILIQGDEAGELHLVHNEGPNQEWQFWYQQGKCNKPINGWDSVSSKGDVLLRSGQQCPLLFKFISLREGVNESNQENQQPPQVLRPKKIKVTLVSRDQMPVQTLELRVRPREQFCDQVFRYYEPQNTKAYLRLPKGFAPFFSLTKGMTVKTSNNASFEAGLNYETGEVYVMTQVPEHPPRAASSYVFLYADPHLSTLLACCKVEVFAMQTQRLKV
jgi:hypothetical protein